jgi:hypothetical protein
MTRDTSGYIWWWILASALSPHSFAGSVGAETPPSAIRGVWRLRSIYETKNVQGINFNQSTSLVGSRMIIGANWIASCDQRVQVSGVKTSSESAAAFSDKSNGVSLRDVGIQRPQVEYVELTGDKSGNCFGTYQVPGEQIFIKNQNELVVYFTGVYYRATRVLGNPH